MDKRIIHMIAIFVFLQAGIVSVAFAEGGRDVPSDAKPSNSYEENLRRWQNMSEEERQAIRQKVHVMDTQQREAVLENAKQFKRLPAEEQVRIHRNFRKFKELPNDKKESLRDQGRRFQKLPIEERVQLRRGVRGKADRKEGPGGPGLDRKLNRDNGNIPPGKAGSQGRERPGFRGGPGAGPDNDNKLSGPRGGARTGLKNPSGPKGGRGAGPDRKSAQRQGPRGGGQRGGGQPKK